MSKQTINRILQQGIRIYREWSKAQQQPEETKPSRAFPKPPARQRSSPTAASQNRYGYPGDYRGPVNFIYAPHLDGDPDPGEIVWTWVPYEEDHTQGKDRPVILVAKEDDYLLGLMLTSKDHNNTNRSNKDYLDIGTGPWDKEGRASEVKLNRVIRVKAADMRREGAILDRATFAHIEHAFHARHR